jgi:hypothetical protein
MADRTDALKDYVEVNVRIEKFYQKYPNGRIITEILSWENGTVVMKATTFRQQEDAVPSSTGHAYEKEGSTYINKTSALENCETSAVGRALAMLGFEIKKSVASKEEVANAKLNQGETQAPINKAQAPVNKPQAPTKTQSVECLTKDEQKQLGETFLKMGFNKENRQDAIQLVIDTVGYPIQSFAEIKRSDYSKLLSLAE